jgi:hypothetical protein
VIKNRISPHLETQIHEAQAGFRKDRGVTDHIFAVRQIMRAAKRTDTTLAMAFIDITKAYDCVNRDMLFKLLAGYGIPPKIINAIKAMYDGSSVSIRNGKEISAPFQVLTGVRQGCLLSCMLFDIVMDAVTRRFLEKCVAGGISVLPRGEKLRALLYADDVVLFAHSRDDIDAMLQAWDSIAMEYGLETSTDKTKVMYVSPDATPRAPITVRGKLIEEVDTFRYLGTILSRDGSMTKEIAARIRAADFAYMKYRNPVFTNRELSLRTKASIFRSSIGGALTYGAEAWVLTADERRQLAVKYNTLMRWVLGVEWYHEISNVDLHALARLPSFERLFASRTLRWLGHAARLSPERYQHHLIDDTRIFDSPITRRHGDPWFQPKGPNLQNIISIDGLLQCTCKAAAELATRAYPRYYVPQFSYGLMTDRVRWRRFSFASDESQSWDAETHEWFYEYFVRQGFRAPLSQKMLGP